jgi:peptidoglycan/LPS O-acetylase OafA/YrhL
MMSYIMLFFAAFFMVGLLGLQSKNVQHSRYLAAAATSMGISLANFIFVKSVAMGGYDTLLVVMVGGASGIMTAIYAHDHHLMKGDKK